MVTEPPQRKQKRSLILEADMLAWITAKAQAEDLSESQVVRRLIRAAMNAEYVARRDDVDTEQG